MYNEFIVELLYEDVLENLIYQFMSIYLMLISMFKVKLGSGAKRTPTFSRRSCDSKIRLFHI